MDTSEGIAKPPEPRDRVTQRVAAVTNVTDRFDHGVSRGEAARMLKMSLNTFDRHFTELVARGLVEMPRLTRTRVFSARSCERVLHGLSVRQARRGR